MTIKELRQMKGLTLAAFAESIGIGMSTLTGYEAGKRQPSEKALAAIKEVYGVDLANTPSPSGDAPAPAEKKVRQPRAKKGAVPAPAVKKAEEKKSRKPRAKKEPTPAPVEEKVEKKTSKQPAKIIIQSLMGGEITPEEILSRVGDVDKVYIKVEENAAYWVKGDETGAINIW